MATKDAERATVTVPAEYLEDVRSALVSEINQDGEALQVNQAALLGPDAAAHREGRREDRDASVRWLRNDLQLLEQLLAASEATTVTADCDALAEVLQAMARVLSSRLADVCQYAPVPMGGGGRRERPAALGGRRGDTAHSRPRRPACR